jgi:hypothetical protein
VDTARVKLGLVVVPLVLVAFVSIYTTTAEAGGYFAEDPDSQPSIFTYGFRGMGVGALNGLAVGYLVVYSEVSSVDEWRILLASTGIGALGGMGLGFGTGFIDLMMYRRYPNGNYVGLGAVILRDSLYGGLCGTLAGVIGGGVAALVNDEPESIALGAAIGALSGTAFGIVIGVIEGRVLTRRHESAPRRARLRFNLTPMITPERRLFLGPGVMGTF